MAYERLSIIVDRYGERVRSIGLQAMAQPATDEDVRNVIREAQSQLGVELDAGYLALAKLADGIGADGTRIYCTKRLKVLDPGEEHPHYKESLVAENLRIRVDYPKEKIHASVIYGIGELIFIAQDLESKRFQLRSRTNWARVIEERATFQDILWEEFRYSLELEPNPDEE